MSCMFALNYRNQAIALTEICGQTVCRNSGGHGESRPLALKRGHILDGLAARVNSCPSRSFRVAARLKPRSYLWNELAGHHTRNYFAVTRECVMAWTESAMRFCTPTLRISFATCAFTVRSSIPRAEPISLLERPATSISRTSFSRSVNVIRPAGKMRPGDALTRSMKVESTRRGAHTEPCCT